jgi:hypothetical protein
VVGGGGAASVDTVGGDEVSVERRCTRGGRVAGSHLSKWFYDTFTRLLLEQSSMVRCWRN